MGIITPTNREVLEFKGLHLYHSGISNCSMRVRVALEEKNLPWTSHHLEITKKEHLTPEYFGINPKGLVPCLVDDGVVINESDDIIDHIDLKWPTPSLRPTSETGLAEMYEWMKLATDNHVSAVKTYIYFHRVQGTMAQSVEQKKNYEKLQSDKELLEFHKKSSGEEGFSQEEADHAEQFLIDCFSKAEGILTKNDWLVDNQFSLADITWMPLHFTLVRADFSFERFPAIEDWAARISERESYKKAVLDWWPGFGG